MVRQGAGKEEALQALKAAQQALATPGGGGEAVAAAEGRAALAALAALRPPPPASQLASWRYNFARSLVSSKAFADAHAEAWLLFQHLSGAADAGPDAPAMAVGTALTLALCCVEGRLLGGEEQVAAALQAALSLPRWLSQLKEEEAAKHGDAAYRYLYKAAVGLLERQAWAQAAAACGAMLGAAGGDAAQQQRAVTAAGKLCAHMPSEEAAPAVAAVALQASSSAPGLSSGAALELLGLLCSAVQRAPAPAPPQLAETALSCAASSQPLLATAALLLPALVAQPFTERRSKGSSAAAAEWEHLTRAAIASVTDTIQQLEGSLSAGEPLPLGERQRQLAFLEAAFVPTNALRRVLAGQGGSGMAGSSATACRLAAAALEALAGMVGVASRVASDSAPSSLSSQGHAAAVALATAARLRAACTDGDPEPPCSSEAVCWLLGWDLASYCRDSSALPPPTCVVEAQELSWLASALFNVGVDLHGGQQYAAAASAMRAAVAAAAVGLRALAEAGNTDQEAAATRLADFCRKCAALSDAQQRAGDAAGALASLARCVALLQQLGFCEPSAWQPLVQAHVRLQAELPGAAEQPQPARRGKAAASKKAATAAAGSGAEQPLAASVVQHAVQLPQGSVAAVVEEELRCWAALDNGGGCTPATRRACRLLQQAFPPASHPLEHAGVLLALHSLGLSSDGDETSGSQLLERAVAALEQARGEGASAALVRARCMLALDAAHRLASQALLEQQQERQRSHAAASTSATGSAEQDAAAVQQLASAEQSDAAAWQRVQQAARQAVEALQSAESVAVSGHTQAALEELAWLLGLHGGAATAEQLRSSLPTLGSEDALSACLFPGARGPTAELQQQAEEAAAAVTSRSGGAVMQRAALHGAAAEAFAAEGDMVAGLYHASEAQRLLATLFHGQDGDGGGGSAAPSDVGWWRLAGAYLGSLLQLGRLFEAAGLADEALHALREGQRLAVAAGARPLAAVFAALLASVYCNQGQLSAAEQAAATAQKQLEPLGSAAASTLAQRYCAAMVHLAAAQLTSSQDGGKAAGAACEAAVKASEQLMEEAADAGGAPHAWCRALHAAALLVAADAALQRGDRPAALRHAAAAAEGGSATACSAVRHQRAAALLFLGQQGSSQADSEQHLDVWGLGKAGSGAEAPPPAAGRARKAPAKPAARSRSKAAAAADAAAEASPPGSGAGIDAGAQPSQQLWQALELSRGQLSTHRAAAAALAEAVARQGRLHLAAWLVHSSLGAAMRLLYQLVLLSRRQQLLQRQRRRGAGSEGGGDLAAQAEQLEELAAVLQPGIDWELVAQLAGGSGGEAAAAPPPKQGRRGVAVAKSAPAPADPAAALAALEQQAAQQLQAWQAALPAGTAACSIAVLPSGGRLLISRLAPAGSSEAAPPLLVALPVQQLSASLSQHPIRALRLDDDDDGPAGGSGGRAATSSVQSVVGEMAEVLAGSGRSMRELPTDTKEQQREWWRARLALDDRLCALVKHLDASWLGPWRCLLLGDPPAGGTAGGAAAAGYMLELLEAAGQAASPQQAAILRHACAVLAQHAGSADGSSGAGMSAAELRQAAHQLCHAAGLACSQEQQHRLEALLAAASSATQPGQRAAAAAVAAAADTDSSDAQAAPRARARKAGGKSVKFADDAEQQQQPPQQEQREQQAAASTPAAGGRAARGRRPAADRSSRRAAASTDEAAAMEVDGDASPIATLSSLDGSVASENDPPQTAAQGGLCDALGSLALDDPAPDTAAAAPNTAARAAGTATAARSGKHRSRLRMMQAGTPGPASVRRPAAAAAATAPRPACELPLTAAKTAPPAAARPSAAETAEAEARGPVLLVLDGVLQVLPWESAPGLQRQRLYRMPSLACAATSAQRASTSVDLSSTFYALNPSGDLTATQSTFQDWFGGMRGWQGKAGSAPTAAELAAALTSRQLFLYCGHGGGEQYISAAKLRSLERCSAALLMGCSSGRLRVQQRYEPVGAVLAYLLAGCPAAVANLWDVTDKDIDRFSQAVLTRWISGGGSGSGGSSSGGSGGGDGSSSSSSSGAGDGGEGGGRGTDVCAAVAASRGACKLPYLVGAAPVCYGIPARILPGEA